MTHDLEADNPSLWCRIFGHKFDYTVVEDSDTETIVDAVCTRSNCDYDERLDEETFDRTESKQ